MKSLLKPLLIALGIVSLVPAIALAQPSPEGKIGQLRQDGIARTSRTP